MELSAEARWTYSPLSIKLATLQDLEQALSAVFERAADIYKWSGTFGGDSQAQRVAEILSTAWLLIYSSCGMNFRTEQLDVALLLSEIGEQVD